MEVQLSGENHPLLKDQPESSRSRHICIFKVPNATKENNRELYTPTTIGLGPWHGSRFPDNERLKEDFRGGFLQRINRTFVDVQNKMQEIREDVENCYEHLTDLNEDEFIERMGTDTCFLLEFLLRIFQGNDSVKALDPLFLHDLVLIENQLPMMLLEEIYSLAGNATPSLSQLVFKYFTRFNTKGIPHEAIRAKHFVDLIRSFMLPSGVGNRYERERYVINRLDSVSKLCHKGVVLEVGRDMSLLNVGFQGRVLTLPEFLVDNVSEACFRNVLQLEGHYYPNSPYVADHFYMLMCLVRTEEDVFTLRGNDILVGPEKDASEVVKMIKNMGTGCSFDGMEKHLCDTCQALIDFHDDPDSENKAMVERECCNTLCKKATYIIVAVVGAVLINILYGWLSSFFL